MEQDFPEIGEQHSSSESEQNQEKPQQGKQKSLSKKQQKKLAKKEKWEKQKLIRRQQKRQKEKLKKKEKKMQAKEKEPQEQQKPKKIQQGEHVKKRRDDYIEKMKVGLSVVIDLQFWDLMTEKEQNSLIKQLSHCHSTNRNSEKCFNYILTSATKERQKILADRYNADKWGITMFEQNVSEVFPLQKLVYLTGDAEQDIQKFDSELVYIIGGIVDHNRLKNITYNFAVDKKIQTRRLPMNKVALKASVHFAVNHVWEWMLKGYNGMDWDEALKAVIPLRKLEQKS